MRVLVINAGSSSLKFAVVDAESGETPLSGLAERLGSDEARLVWKGGDGGERALPGAGHEAALAALLVLLSERPDCKPAAIGHRVVHGAEAFSGSVLIDDELVAAVEAVSHLAPLHNPANLLGIAGSRAAFPDLPQVAVFDTAFHQTMPPRAYRYPVPSAWYTEHGIRRYGFHGTSHRFVASAAAKVLGRPVEELAMVTAHLGNGCSACAVLGGQSVDTTMGLTPLEGLVMGTRSGDVDPGLIAHLMGLLQMDVAAVMNQLNKASGLLGLSDGLSNDMRSLLEARDAGNEAAALAVEVFCYRLAKAIAALCVPLGRLDALVFTGGIGEHAAPVRARTLELLAVLGLRADAERNAAHGRTSAGRITPDDATCALVVPTDEEWQIAKDSAALIA
jgi:acetate kinase